MSDLSSYQEREALAEAFNLAVNRAFNEGVNRGREAAALDLHNLASSPQSRYVRTDWILSADGAHKENVEIWLSSVHAVSVARGDYL